MSPSDSLLGAVTVAERARRPDDVLRLPRSRYEAFAALIGWGMLLHLLAERGERSPWLLMAVIGALTVTMRPSSVLGLTTVLVAMTARTITDVDPPPGFWLFLAVLTPFWLGMLYAGLVRHRGWPLMVELGPRFAPVFRTGFVVGWFVVLAHQINDAFFNVATSCTVEIYGRSRDLLFFLPDLAARRTGWLPLGVVIVELVIVVGLWLRPLRRLPIAVAIVFHMVVGAAQPALGALAFAFIVLFMPSLVVDAALDRLAVIGHRRPWWATVIAVFALIVMAVAVIVVVATVVFDHGFLTTSPFAIGPFLASLGTVATGLFLLLAYGAGWFGPDPLTEVDEPMEWIGPVALLMAVVVLALGAAPYVGLGTAYALADYSSVRTEPGRWNHRVLPDAIRVFDTQQPLVRVLDPDHPELQALRRDTPVLLSRVQLVEGELSRRLVRACATNQSGAEVVPLTVARQSAVTIVPDPCADPELARSRGWLLDHALAFRAVTEGAVCLP